jgi:hypothetical protein
MATGDNTTGTVELGSCRGSVSCLFTSINVITSIIKARSVLYLTTYCERLIPLPFRCQGRFSTAKFRCRQDRQFTLDQLINIEF